MARKARALSEAALYEPVEKFVRSGMSCWQARTKAGVADVGEIDVLGVRYAGGELSGQSEVIAIEVKLSTARFAVSAGQTHGYSVVAERCYLAAITESFTPTQVLIASRLGIGLVRIWQTPSGAFRCAEVLSAPTGQPVQELKLKAVDRLGLAACSLCQGLFRRYIEKPDDYKAVVRHTSRGKLLDAAEQGKGLVWWLDEQAEEHGLFSNSGYTIARRYLCPACVRAMSPRP